ncbi:MAG: hypothetical protein QW228_06020 [Candidatus Aenigmatarchaeota archaeon]
MVVLRFLTLDDLIKELKANGETSLRAEIISRMESGVVRHYFLVITGLVKKNIILKFESYLGSCLKDDVEFEKNLQENLEKLKKDLEEKEAIRVGKGIYEE